MESVRPVKVRKGLDKIWVNVIFVRKGFGSGRTSFGVIMWSATETMLGSSLRKGQNIRRTRALEVQ